MNMKNKLFSRFLTTYYLAQALGTGIGKREEDARMYATLAEVYLVNDDERLERFYELSNSEQFFEMNTLAEYERTCRMLEYAAVRGIDTDLSEDDKVILASKREALRIAKAILPNVENLTSDSLTEALLAGISGGDIHSMLMLSFFGSYGFLIGKNKKRSDINLERAVRWNNLDACLLLAYIYPKRREEVLAIISASDKSSYGEELTKYIANKYSIEVNTPSENASLLERAFCLGAVDRNVYDMKFDSIVYSDIISRQDKKHIISTYKKETMHLYFDLPTEISSVDRLKADISRVKFASISRPNEIRRIMRNLVGVETRFGEKYKPLALVCRDAYVLSEYKKALQSVFRDAACCNISAAHLTQNDLYPTKENIFLRSLLLSGKSATVFFIDDCYKLAPQLLSEFSKYLRGDLRASFRLLNPAVGLDLSAMLPVLFFEDEPDPALHEYLDIVRLSMIAKEEKESVIATTLKHYSDIYSIEDIKLSTELVSELAKLSSAEIESSLDEIVKYSAVLGDRGTIELETYKLIMSDMRKNLMKFGF